MGLSRLHRIGGTACVAAMLLTVPASARETPEMVDWNQEQVAALAADLHESVKGLREEIRATPRDIGTMHARAYYRLLDNLRLIERESRYLHDALASGSSRDETRPAFARIAMLRRNCEEEMEKLYLGAPALKRVARAREIVKQMDPYYGFDPERADHERVLGR